MDGAAEPSGQGSQSAEVVALRTLLGLLAALDDCTMLQVSDRFHELRMKAKWHARVQHYLRLYHAAQVANLPSPTYAAYWVLLCQLLEDRPSPIWAKLDNPATGTDEGDDLMADQPLVELALYALVVEAYREVGIELQELPLAHGQHHYTLEDLIHAWHRRAEPSLRSVQNSAVDEHQATHSEGADVPDVYGRAVGLGSASHLGVQHGNNAEPGSSDWQLRFLEEVAKVVLVVAILTFPSEYSYR
jgi:hypothetical protein